MSYILDALRKADAQRVRDPARGIHAQTVAPAQDARASRGRSALLWVAGAAVLVGAAVVILWPSGREPTAPPPQASAASAPPSSLAPAPATTPATAAVAAAPDAAAATQSASPAKPEAPVAAAAAIEPAPPPMPAPKTVPQPAPVTMAKDGGRLAEPSTLPVANLPRQPASAAMTQETAALPIPAPNQLKQPGPASMSKGSTAVAAASAKPAADRVHALAELPAEVQRELPKIAISGGVHSDNPAQRMLIVAGQVVNEGAEIAPGVRLEEIRAKSAVLRFRGYRYSVGY